MNWLIKCRTVNNNTHFIHFQEANIILAKRFKIHSWVNLLARCGLIMIIHLGDTDGKLVTNCNWLLQIISGYKFKLVIYYKCLQIATGHRL